MALNWYADSAHEPFCFAGGPVGALLLPGFMGTPKEMRPLGRALADAGVTARGILLPGFGADVANLGSIRAADWLRVAGEAWEAVLASHERTVLVGFSMGGAVAVHVAADPSVSTVIALAPWFYESLDMAPLDGRRLTVVHGSLDRGLPGIPGVAPALSLRGYELARSRGVDAARTIIPGAIHPIALRAPWGGLVPMPRAARWVELVSDELRRFSA